MGATSVETQLSSDFMQLESRIAALEEQVANAPDPNRLNLVVFSGERDKLLAAFNMATAAAACGCETTLFFTFWAAPVLRDANAPAKKKSIIERMFGWMLPLGVSETSLSKMEFAGIGRKMMTNEMKKKGIADIDELLELARELGVKILVCDVSMKLMGIHPDELIDYPGLDFCGAATFLELSSRANTTMFI
ncbi:MAG: DsrE/DsrF/DrsH-like family protein [Planctomycetales bacterium]|nr:DsrE/DsrF/DrsH-like family protein [Planctomycetales bacterium]